MSLVELIYGGADWAAGFADSEPPEEIQQELQGEVSNEASPSSDEYEWSFISQIALFVIIIGCVALYVRMTRQRSAREDVGYEKTLS